MIRSRTKVLAITAGLGLVAAVMPGLQLRGEPRILTRAAGVTIERIDEALVPHGDRLDADDGDLMLSNGDLQLVVGATHEAGDDFEYGAILDITGPGWSDDALGSMRPALMISDRRATLVTDRVEPTLGNGAPGIRIMAHEESTGLSLTTDINVRAKKASVDIVTRVTNRGKSLVSVRLGDELAWPGVATFAPGFGEVEETGRQSLPWIARRGPLSYGLVFPDGPADVDFRANQSDTDQTCWAKVTDVPPGATATYHRVFVATRRGVSEVAKIAAQLTGRPIGRVIGTLAPAPAWAILTAIAPDGTIALKEAARPDGRFELALSPSRYTVLLQTPGGYDQTVVDVQAGSKPTLASLVSPQAERLDFRITDDQGQLIPGRLIVDGIDGTPDPRFASVPRVSAAGNEVHTVTGEGRVDLPPGKYRVIVSRGIEWSVERKVIDVKPEQGVALRVALTHELDTPGWISADLHLHAAPSGDSELPLDDRIASLVSAGVEFAVATDHNHVTDYGPTIDALGALPVLSSARGVEVTTRTWGHFNAYPLPQGAPAPPFSVDPPEIFAGIHKIAPDAVIQVNHPWDPGYGYFRRAVLNERTGTHWRKQFSFDFDLIEVVNGYELGKVDVLGKNLERYFDLLNLGRHYTAVGSSDSHKLTNEWAGYPRTYVRVADDRPGRASATEIAASLRAGHTVVSLGPFIDARVGEAGPGDTLHVLPGTVPLEVTARSADWVDVARVDVVLGGDVVESFDIDPQERGSVRWARTIDVPVAHDSWIVVVVRGERTIDEVLPGLHVAPFAFTNPIWVSVGEPPPESPHHERAPRHSPPVKQTVTPADSPLVENQDVEGPAPPAPETLRPIDRDAGMGGD